MPMRRVLTATVCGVVMAVSSVGCDEKGQAPPPPDYDAAASNAPVPAVALPAELDMLPVTQMFNSGPVAKSQPKDFASGSAAPSSGRAKLTTTDYGWRVNLPSGSPIATPAVAQGLVYLTGGYHSNDMFCLDAATGAQRWAVTLSDNGPSMPAVADGTVIVNTESCTIFALDAQTGAERWSKYLGDPQLSAPAIGNGMAISSYPTFNSGGTSHGIVAFDLKTGTMAWRTLVDGDVISSPVVADDQVLAATLSGLLYRLDLETGKPLAAAANRITSAPSPAGDDVYFARRSDPGVGGPYAEAIGAWADGQSELDELSDERPSPYLDPRVQDRSKLAGASRLLDAAVGFGEGTPIAVSVAQAKDHLGHATVAALQAFQGSRPLVVGDRVYSSMGDTLVCLDRATGNELWATAFPGDLAKEGGSLVTAPAYAGGSLVVGTVGGEVHRIDPATGQTMTKWDVGLPIRQQVAIDGGRIYVPTSNGQLHCIETGDASLTGWTGWGANAERNNRPEP